MKLEIQRFAAATFAFAPLNEATGVTTASPTITITASAAIRYLNDSAILDADVANLITLKKTNANGADVPFTATINAGKTIITIVPSPELEPSTTYYLAIDGTAVENVSNEASSDASVTWTTSAVVVLAGTVVPNNSIVEKTLVVGDVDNSTLILPASDEKTIIVVYNSSADTAYDVTVKAPVSPNYAGFGVSNLVKEVAAGKVAVIRVESAKYADVTGKITMDVENAALKFAVFYRD